MHSWWKLCWIEKFFSRRNFCNSVVSEARIICFSTVDFNSWSRGLCHTGKNCLTGKMHCFMFCNGLNVRYSLNFTSLSETPFLLYLSCINFSMRKISDNKIDFVNCAEWYFPPDHLLNESCDSLSLLLIVNLALD